MIGNGTRESLVRELHRLVEDAHKDLIAQLGLSFRFDAVHKHRDTWVVPVSLDGNIMGDAGAVNDLIRSMRRSLESKLDNSVSILIDPDEE